MCQYVYDEGSSKLVVLDIPVLLCYSVVGARSLDWTELALVLWWFGRYSPEAHINVDSIGMRMWFDYVYSYTVLFWSFFQRFDWKKI